ncbi:MAG TPA: pyridoxamine 5'-phosphate oxidase family protein [Thermoanaerobaculia bacterium]|jgi:hypothetical protein
MSVLQTDRTTVHRLPERARYDAATVNAIIDEALICYVGFVVGGDTPVVIPTIHWRDGETLYFHGSPAAGMLRNLKNGIRACATITLLDGLVMARSAFHHSMNYRSAVVFGTAREVTGEEKLRALDLLVDHVCRGRSAEVRPPNEIELRKTIVLALPIEEASAKIRTGGPVDDEEDYALDIWAGVIPLRMTPQSPIADERLRNGIAVPDYATNYRR